MNLLLDTQITLWWLGDTPELPNAVREVVQDTDNVVYVSAATIWEIAIKRALGKLEIGDEYVSEIAEQGFVELPIRWQHAARVEALPSPSLTGREAPLSNFGWSHVIAACSRRFLSPNRRNRPM